MIPQERRLNITEIVCEEFVFFSPQDCGPASHSQPCFYAIGVYIHLIFMQQQTSE